MVLLKEDLSNVQQIYIKVIEPIKINTIKRLNKVKKWEYGYNKEHDVVVISKTGQIGEMYEHTKLSNSLPKNLKKYISLIVTNGRVTEST